MRTCTVKDCNRKHEAKGYCSMHYTRYLKHGDPLLVLPASGGYKKKNFACSVSGCASKYLAKGFCKKHYTQNRKANEHKICIVPECDKKQIAAGLCTKHHNRKVRNKPLEAKSHHEMSAKERLMSKVKVDDLNGCWIWFGAKCKKGYGMLSYNGKRERAHRLSYKIFNGEIKDSLLVCHKCDTPSCINPEHLFLGTALDNSIDMLNKGRENPSPGQKNGNSKLKNEEVKEIKKLLKDGASLKALSDMYKVSPENLSFIKKGITWSSINV